MAVLDVRLKLDLVRTPEKGGICTCGDMTQLDLDARVCRERKCTDFIKTSAMTASQCLYTPENLRL